MTLHDQQISENVAELFSDNASASVVQNTQRPWPPVMIRDFLRTLDTRAQRVDSSTTIGYVADILSTSRGACIAVYAKNSLFLGIAVDEDVMALIKRDGVRALDYPIIEAVQRSRPVCSITDSPVVVLQLMREEGWDRIGVSQHGEIIGIIHRRDLVNFLEN